MSIFICQWTRTIRLRLRASIKRIFMRRYWLSRSKRRKRKLKKLRSLEKVNTLKFMFGEMTHVANLVLNFLTKRAKNKKLIIASQNPVASTWSSHRFPAVAPIQLCWPTLAIFTWWVITSLDSLESRAGEMRKLEHLDRAKRTWEHLVL